MKSNKISFIAALMLIVMISSCKKQFTDLKPYNALPLPDALSSEAGLNTAVNGMYASLRSANLYGRTLPLKGDLMADNLYIKASNSGRYLDFNDYNITVGNANAQGVWQSSYVAIKNINTVINSPLPANANISQFRGEAFAARALMNFDLVRNFAQPYTVNQTALGVPLVTSFDQNSLPTRNTVKEVYDQINSDLNQAFNLMTFNVNSTMTISGTGQTRALNSSYFTKWATRALQAKVYMHMGDWANAKTAALDVVQNSGVTLVSNASYVSYWKSPTPRTDKVETFFEVSSDAVDNNGFNSLSYFFDAAGYGDALVTNEFYGQFSATDIRRQLIIPVVSGGFTVYYVNKYSNSSNATDRDDQKIIRFSDVLLILAEAYARTNDEVNAKIRLNQVAQNRDPSFTGYTSTGAQLINDIIAERRKELAFEGDRFFDLQRINATINKVRRENPTQLIVVAPTNFMRIFPIPQVEIDVNPNIRSQQNPGY
ncbi:MAG: RagB/SusD family nutrient uptake outer membrane protein [Bacteroidetes bacterium]|nr:MAG: RagB/SusD family nutrient uptake outer membrane protein [Bacteroidota bacterium]